MDHDQWNRRIRGRLHYRCLQPDTSGISDCQSASPGRALSGISKTNEKLTQGTHVYNLETSQHAGKGHSPIRTQGQRFLTDFSCDGTVCFSYAAGNIRMDKHLALLRESNTVAISYTITNQGEEAGLSITPLMNFREHSASSAVSDLQFTCEPNTVGGFTLIPAAAPGLCIELSCSAGRLFHVKTNTTWICSTRRK